MDSPASVLPPSLPGRGLRVLVCGGREFGYMPRGVVRSTMAWYRSADQVNRERALLSQTLDGMSIAFLIHGGARGADELASLWAAKKDIPQQAYTANWYPNGRKGGLDKSAGPRRNQRMLDEGRPDLVVAFPGGNGTADMVRRAKAAGVEVIEIPHPLPIRAGDDGC